LMSLGFYLYSVIGVVAARGIVSLILFVLSLVAARHLIGTNAAWEAANLWRVAAACAIMTILALWLRHGLVAMHLAAPLELAMISIFGSAVYVGSLLALGMRLKSYVAAVCSRCHGLFGQNHSGPACKEAIDEELDFGRGV